MIVMLKYTHFLSWFWCNVYSGVAVGWAEFGSLRGPNLSKWCIHAWLCFLLVATPIKLGSQFFNKWSWNVYSSNLPLKVISWLDNFCIHSENFGSFFARSEFVGFLNNAFYESPILCMYTLSTTHSLTYDFFISVLELTPGNHQWYGEWCFSQGIYFIRQPFRHLSGYYVLYGHIYIYIYMWFLSCLDPINIFMKHTNSPSFLHLPFERLMKLSSLCELLALNLLVWAIFVKH